MKDSIRMKIKSFIPEDWDIILIFFFLAFALRLYFALAFDVQPKYKEMTTLIQFAELGEYDKFVPPLYILFLRMIFRIFGFENFKAVYVIQGFFSSLTVIPMYVIARNLSNRIAGGIAAAITAIQYLFQTRMFYTCQTDFLVSYPRHADTRKETHRVSADHSCDSRSVGRLFFDEGKKIRSRLSSVVV